MTKIANIARNSSMVVAWAITIVLRREKNVHRLVSRTMSVIWRETQDRAGATS
nr:unnamed protein product [Callosobruchus analis]